MRKKKLWWWNYNPKRKCVKCGKKVELSDIRSGGWCFRCLSKQYDYATFLLGTLFVKKLCDKPLPDSLGFMTSLEQATEAAISSLPSGDAIKAKLVYSFVIANKLTIEWARDFVAFEHKPVTRAVRAVEVVARLRSIVGIARSKFHLETVRDYTNLKIQECIAAGLVEPTPVDKLAAKALEQAIDKTRKGAS